MLGNEGACYYTDVPGVADCIDRTDAVLKFLLQRVAMLYVVYTRYQCTNGCETNLRPKHGTYRVLTAQSGEGEGLAECCFMGGDIEVIPHDQLDTRVRQTRGTTLFVKQE